MNILKNKNLILLILFAAISLAAYVWFIRQPVFEDVVVWAQQNFWLYIGILIFIKIVAIVWPPLPGGILTFGSIPVIGWLPSFFAEVLSSMIGSSIAYYLGKKYGYSFLRKIFDERIILKIQRIKISKKKEFEGIFFLRIFTGMISEAISYGSGLVGIRFRNFFVATLLVELAWLPIFYAFSDLFAGRNMILYLPPVVILAIIFWKMRGRYFA